MCIGFTTKPPYFMEIEIYESILSSDIMWRLHNDTWKLQSRRINLLLSSVPIDVTKNGAVHLLGISTFWKLYENCEEVCPYGYLIKIQYYIGTCRGHNCCDPVRPPRSLSRAICNIQLTKGDQIAYGSAKLTKRQNFYIVNGFVFSICDWFEQIDFFANLFCIWTPF